MNQTKLIELVERATSATLKQIDHETNTLLVAEINNKNEK